MHRTAFQRIVPVAWAAAGLLFQGCVSGGTPRNPDPPSPVTAPVTAASSVERAPESGRATIDSSTASSAADTPDPMIAVVRARGAQLRTCYEEYGLKQAPELSGTLSIGLDVAADGAVSEARIVTQEWSGSSSDGDITRTVGRCILDRVGTWRFPPDVTVPGKHTFDFRFSR